MPPVQHGDVVVAEVAQEPPEPRRAAVHPLVVGDDEDAGSDSRRPGSAREVLLGRERMAPSGIRRRGREVLLHVEEGRAGNVALQVELAAAAGLPQLPAAVDEPVPHASAGEPVDHAASVDDEKLAVPALSERRDVQRRIHDKPAPGAPACRRR